MANEIMLKNSKDFFAVDFSDLADTINSLANCAQRLSPEEKQTAISAVREWERVIKNQLTVKRREAARIVDALMNPDACNLTNSEFEAIATNIHIEPLYEAYIKEVNAVNEITQQIADINARYDGITRDTDEGATAMADRDVEVFTASAERQKHAIKRNAARRALVKSIVSDKSIQATLADARAFVDNVTRYENEAILKAQNIRVNIAIDDDRVKEALKELLNFTLD